MGTIFSSWNLQNRRQHQMMALTDLCTNSQLPDFPNQRSEYIAILTPKSLEYSHLTRQHFLGKQVQLANHCENGKSGVG